MVNLKLHNLVIGLLMVKKHCNHVYDFGGFFESLMIINLEVHVDIQFISCSFYMHAGGILETIIYKLTACV